MCALNGEKSEKSKWFGDARGVTKSQQRQVEVALNKADAAIQRVGEYPWCMVPFGALYMTMDMLQSELDGRIPRGTSYLVEELVENTDFLKIRGDILSNTYGFSTAWKKKVSRHYRDFKNGSLGLLRTRTHFSIDMLKSLNANIYIDRGLGGSIKQEYYDLTYGLLVKVFPGVSTMLHGYCATDKCKNIYFHSSSKQRLVFPYVAIDAKLLVDKLFYGWNKGNSIWGDVCRIKNRRQLVFNTVVIPCISGILKTVTNGVDICGEPNTWKSRAAVKLAPSD